MLGGRVQITALLQDSHARAIAPHDIQRYAPPAPTRVNYSQKRSSHSRCRQNVVVAQAVQAGAGALRARESCAPSVWRAWRLARACAMRARLAAHVATMFQKLYLRGRGEQVASRGIIFHGVRTSPSRRTRRAGRRAVAILHGARNGLSIDSTTNGIECMLIACVC